MKRIAAYIGLTAYCTLAVAFYLSGTAIWIVMASCAAAGILFLLIKKTRKTVFLPAIAITAALFCGVNLIYTAAAVDPVAEKYCGEEQQIKATLTEEAYRQYDKYCYPCTTDSIDGEKVRVKILLRSYRPIDIEPFDSISFCADLSPTENSSYLAKGYYLTVGSVHSEYSVTQNDSRPLYDHVIRLRQSMRDALDEFLPKDEANLCKAVLIGDKYALDPSVKDDFRSSGGSYLIVVSGMHFSLIVMMSFWLFRKLFRKRWIYFPLTYLVIFLYMLITGFQPSVVRSGVMMLILITGRMIRRISDPLTSLGIAGLLMPVFFSPYGCGDIGMILSFAATFSLIVWQQPIYQRISIKKRCDHRAGRWGIKCLNAVLSLISTSLAANILVLPLSVFLFNGFSLMTILTALLLYPLIWLTLVLSLVVCVLYYAGPLRYVALLFSWPLYGVTKVTLWLVHGIASLPFAYIRVRSLWFYIWMLITLIVGIAAYLVRKRCRLYPYVALLSAILFLGGMTVNTVIQLHTDQLEFYTGTEGATVYLNRSGRLHLLRFDCDSVSAYRMNEQLSDDYGGAFSAVCTTYQESVNYSRLFDWDFPTAHYLVSSGVGEYCEENPEHEEFSGKSVFVLDDGLVLNTIESDKKTLLYLTDGDRSVMLIPADYPLDAIPEEMRYADIIFLNQPDKAYDKLFCDTLVLCRAQKPNETDPMPKSDSRYDLTDQHITFKLN